MSEVALIKTNLRRYTFESPKILKWVQGHCHGRVLNLFCGSTQIGRDELRVDADKGVSPDFVADSVDFVREWTGEEFDTIIVDPPYSYRKSMEMYDGRYSSRFKQLADEIPEILSEKGKVISFGYHSTFLGKVRGFDLEQLCVFAHGGAQHCTIGIVESKQVA